jgi:hypothetical protein
MSRSPELPLIPYIRVSRIGGRSNDDRITEDVQLDEITTYARKNKLQLTAPVIELNRSGGTTNHRYRFLEAVARVRNGEAGGIIVMKLNRFARSTADALDFVHQIEHPDVAGRFVSVSEQIDRSTPQGQFVFTLFAALAELELSQISQTWETNIGYVIRSKGVHVSKYTPFAYLRFRDFKDRFPASVAELQTREPYATQIASREDGLIHGAQLVPSPDEEAILVEAFKRRAGQGFEIHSWAQLAEWLTSTGFRPRGTAGGRKDGAPSEYWTRNSARSVIGNDVYLGIAQAAGPKLDQDKNNEKRRRAYKFRNEEAHAPLVDRPLFDAANAAGASAARTGEVAAKALCRGLLTCGGCGHVLVTTGQTVKGERVPVYYCRKVFADMLCTTPASIAARKIDPFIEQAFLDRVAAPPKIHRPIEHESRLPELHAKLETAVAERDAHASVAGRLILSVGEEQFEADLALYDANVDLARAALDEEGRFAEVTENINSGDLLNLWPAYSINERNEILRVVIDHVEIAPTSGNKRGRWAPPAEQRVKNLIFRPGVLK